LFPIISYQLRRALSLYQSFRILISSGYKKGTRIYYPVFLKKLPASDSPPGFPVEPLGREIPACGTFLHLSKYISYCLSIRVPGKGAPSMFPDRVPTDRDTSSPEPLAKRGVSIYFFIYSFIHSCMSAGVSKKEPSYIHTGKT
jgi:hypothetical protein